MVASSRMDNSIKNSIVAIAFKILQIMLPFVTRTIVIKMLGLSYVGISGLFTSIFGLLGIAELGVGSAMLHALYVPIENKEKARINAIINFYRKAYAVIGIVILVLGLCLTPFLKSFIKAGTYPENLNLYYIYLVNLSSTIISYLVYSYKSLLLDANQLGRAANKVRIWMTLISYAVQIAILMFTKNYYLYILLSPITTLISAIWIAKITDKVLPGFKPEGSLSDAEKEHIFKDVKALFLYKIGGVAFNSVDSVVISWLFGAVILGIYNNYYYIVSSVSTIFLVVYSAVLPSFGSSVVSSSVEKNYNDFMKIAFLDQWINGWCAICLFCLLPPFINIWIGPTGDLGEGYALLFGIYFFCWRILDPISVYKDALGLWSMDRWRPFLTAIVNLLLNIALTLTMGLPGILISSIIAVILVSYPFSVKYLFKYFGRSCQKYFMQMFTSFSFVLGIGTVVKILCKAVNTGNKIFDFILMCIFCVTMPNICFLIFFRKKEAIIMLRKRIYRNGQGIEK